MRRRELITGLCVAPLGGCLRLTGNNTNQNNTEEGSPEGIPDPDSLFSIQWTHEYLDSIEIYDQYIYGKSSTGLTKLDRSDGTEVWETSPQEPINLERSVNILPTDDRLYVFHGGHPPNAYDEGDSDGEVPILFSLNMGNGEVEWYFEGDIAAWPHVDPLFGTNKYIGYFQNDSAERSILRVFNDNAKKPVIERKDGPPINDTIIEDTHLFIFTNKHLKVIDIKSNSIAHSRTGFYNNPNVTSDSILYTEQGTLYSLNRKTEQQWEQSIDIGRFTSRPVVYNGNILIGSKSGLHCFGNNSGEEQWKIESEVEINEARGGIAVVNGISWVWDNAGFLYVVDVESGQILFKQRGSDEFPGTSFATSEPILYASVYSEDSIIPQGTSALEISRQ